MTATIDASKSLLDATKPITSEIPEGEIDPSVLMRNIHEANHSKNSLFVGHVTEVLSSRAVLLPPKPGFLEVLVEFLDDLRPTLGQPGSPLVFR